MNRLTFLALAALSTPAWAGPAAEDPRLREGDPPRWNEPIVTSAQRLESALKESRNAMADAIKECRASAERKACEAEARAQYEREVTTAKKQVADRPQ